MRKQEYKGHPTYAIAVRGPGTVWCPTGLVVTRNENLRAELKLLEPTDVIFATKEEAEEHAIRLCRAWIDEFCVVSLRQSQMEEDKMSTQAAEHHKKAAEHHEHAAHHHKEAAKHYAAGTHEKAAHHAHVAHGHHIHATDHAREAAKSHVEHHGKK